MPYTNETPKKFTVTRFRTIDRAVRSPVAAACTGEAGDGTDKPPC